MKQELQCSTHTENNVQYNTDSGKRSASAVNEGKRNVVQNVTHYQYPNQPLPIGALGQFLTQTPYY